MLSTSTERNIEKLSSAPASPLNASIKTFIIYCILLLIVGSLCFAGWNFYKQQKAMLVTSVKIIPILDATTVIANTNIQNNMNDTTRKQPEKTILGIWKPQIVTIKETKTVVVGDLSITNMGGGHKILMTEDNRRGGDLSFADLSFETTRKNKWITKVFNSSDTLKSPFVFDNYIITTKEVGWNADSVTLSITQLPEGVKVEIAQGETRDIEGITIKIIGVYHKTIISNGVFRQNFEFILTDSDGNQLHKIADSGESVVFSGHVMKVNKISSEANTVQVTMIDVSHIDATTKK